MRDKPRPPGYWPNTPSQWREATVDDCTWYSTEFAWQSEDKEHRNFHPVRDIRSQSTDRVGGTPVSVAMRDTAKFWPADAGVGWKYGLYDKAEIRRALRSGAVVVLGGDYKQLPLHYRRWTNNDDFAHAMAIKFLLETGFTRMYDPLGGGPQRDEYDGEWIQFNQLFGVGNYTWGNSDRSRFWVGIVEQRHEETRVAQVTVDIDTATAGIVVKKNTDVHQTASSGSTVLRKFWAEGTHKSLMRGPNGWRMVAWTNQEGEQLAGWVHKDDILRVVSLTPPVPTPPLEGYERDALEDKIAALHTRMEVASFHCENAVEALFPSENEVQ